jgi:hypothetical protein
MTATLQIFTLKPPWSHYTHDVAIIADILKGGKPPRPATLSAQDKLDDESSGLRDGEEIISDTAWEIIDACFEHDSHKRPSASDVLSSFEIPRHNETIELPSFEPSKGSTPNQSTLQPAGPLHGSHLPDQNDGVITTPDLPSPSEISRSPHGRHSNSPSILSRSEGEEWLGEHISVSLWDPLLGETIPIPNFRLGGSANPVEWRAEYLNIRLVPHRASGGNTFNFDPISRDMAESDSPLRLGRPDDIHLRLPAVHSSKIALKSRVVSRQHAEIWVSSGIFYIRDTKSASGTFLNGRRLSPTKTESNPHELKDGDVVQLGVDYGGGRQEIYKCVRIRVEIRGTSTGDW